MTGASGFCSLRDPDIPEDLQLFNLFDDLVSPGPATYGCEPGLVVELPAEMTFACSETVKPSRAGGITGHVC